MYYFILGTAVLYILFAFPQVVLGAVALVVILYYLPKVSLPSATTSEKEEKEEDSEPHRLYGEFCKDGVVDWEGWAENEVEKMFKPGFRDDPEHQASVERIRKHMAEQRRKNEIEEQEELNEELNNRERDFWAKRS